MRRALASFGLLLTVAACALPPEIERALGPEPPGTAYPALVPLYDVLALDNGDPEAAAEANEALAARAAALKAKARALKAAPEG